MGASGPGGCGTLGRVPREDAYGVRPKRRENPYASIPERVNDSIGLISPCANRIEVESIRMPGLLSLAQFSHISNQISNLALGELKDRHLVFWVTHHDPFGQGFIEILEGPAISKCAERWGV